MGAKDIAIIGMSCRFSRSPDPEGFWNHLRNGTELIDLLSNKELKEANVDEKLIGDDAWIRSCSRVPDKDSFDAPFFGYTAQEAALMDPQIRLFHEEAWKALEDAGCDPFTYKGKVGVFAGASENVNWMAHTLLQGNNSDVAPFLIEKLSSRHYLGTLLSYKLNLKGPSYFVDTACSTSLALVHLACRNLLMNECNLALAGAVKISSAPQTGYRYQEGMIASKDGHCRTFDSEASGTIAGEGIGVVVLKRLDDAVRDGDYVYAVIKGSAVNNDGSRKVGYTAPSTKGQAECIMSAHRVAGIQPGTISYVEAHGTGTRLGDPVEIEALNLAFGNDVQKYCAIGSVKSNMGHLDTVAGIAGLIKTVLCLQHKELPPSLHFRTPNPEIRFDDGPFYVNNQLKKWEAARPLRAGVSSFGIGGTNVHVVLEEAPEIPAEAGYEGVHLMVCSAQTAVALEKQKTALTNWLQQQPHALADVAYTLQQRRKHFSHRFCVAVSAGKMDINRGWQGRVETDRKPLVVFMFPGQGAQYSQMGKELYKTQPLFRKIMDEGFELLQQLTGENFLEVLYGRGEEQLHRTYYTQPILFVFEYALAQLLMHRGIRPDHMIGHSIGEFVAACLGGVFSFADGVRVVLERARLMDRSAPGAMLAIRQSEEYVRAALPQDLSIAAVNTPEMCVVAGSIQQIENFKETLNKQGIDATLLKTSHAFHSTMMENAARDFEQFLSTVPMAAPQIPYVSNVTGQFAGEEVCAPDYWSKHILHTVRFSDGLQQLLQQGKAVFLECGPGHALAGFCRQLHSDTADAAVLNLVRHPRQQESDDRFFMERLGQAWVSGIDLNWDAFSGEAKRKAVPVPTYQFDEYRFPVIVDPLSGNQHLLNHAEQHSEKAVSLYWPSWKQTPLFENKIAASHHRFLFFADESEISKALGSILERDGHSVIKIIKGNHFEITGPLEVTIRSGVKHDYQLLAEWIHQQPFSFDHIVYLWQNDIKGIYTYTLETPATHNDFLDLLFVYQAFRLHLSGAGKRLFFLTRQAVEVAQSGEATGSQPAPVPALLKIWQQESPDLFTCHLDISLSGSAAQQATAIYKELLHGQSKTTVAFRGGLRWTETFEPVTKQPPSSTRIREKGTYLITGGLGKLGACLAEYLLTHYQANVVLTGRSEIGENETHLSGISKVKELTALKALPGYVLYYTADVADFAAFNEVVASVTQLLGPIHGVLHAAGNNATKDFKLLEQTGEQEVERHFGPKVNGLINLYRLFRHHPLDFVWVTSSLSVILGGLGYGAYAGANGFMSSFMAQQRSVLHNWLSVELDGLAFNNTQKSEWGISKKELIDVFEQSLQMASLGRLIVVAGTLEERWKGYNSKDTTPNKKAPANATAQAARPSLGNAYLPPQSETETILCGLWQDILGIEQIGIADNFLELGGDSLKAMSLLRKIHITFEVDLPIDFFFKNLTIDAYAREIDIIRGLKKIQAVHTSAGALQEIII